MIRLPIALVVLFLSFPANAERLITGLSFESVAITSDFTGTELVVFGTVDDIPPERAVDGESSIAQYDIIVVIEGPRQPRVVRKKDRIAGIWINNDNVSFDDVPASYLVLASRDFENDADFANALRNIGIGFDNVPMGNILSSGDTVEPIDFREAVVRLKSERGIYLQEQGIQFIGENLFRARFEIPAVIPIGIHQVRSYLLFDNELVSGSTHAVRISKSGFEQWIFTVAHNHGYLYGIGCVILAVLTGWLSSVVFRRD